VDCALRRAGRKDYRRDGRTERVPAWVKTPHPLPALMRELPSFSPMIARLRPRDAGQRHPRVDAKGKMRLGLHAVRSRSSRASHVGYSITSSASASNLSGISRPSALAVLRLITSSNFVGCSTGKSAGLEPFKILST